MQLPLVATVLREASALMRISSYTADGWWKYNYNTDVFTII